MSERPPRSYRVTLRCYSFTVDVDAATEDQAIDEAIAQATLEADFEVDEVVMTRGEPDPPPPPPMPKVEWMPEPLRSQILESASAWTEGHERVWCVTLGDQQWATNGHFAFRLPAGVAHPDGCRQDATQHFGEWISASTERGERASATTTIETLNPAQSVVVYECGNHWPLAAVYVDLLERLCEATTWTFHPARDAEPAVLRGDGGDALAVLMPVRPA